MSTSDFVPAPTRKQVEHALLLIARQHGGNASAAKAAQEALSEWRQADPSNEAAARAALHAWRATEASGLQGSVPLPPTQPARTAQTRRRIISTLGLAGLLASVAAVSRWHWLQPLQQLALQTDRGQLLSRQLHDGSRLDLGPRTSARISIWRDRREVRLASGEIRFEVQSDVTRPFTVFTDWGKVQVLGTSFTVAVRDQHMTVAVAQGRVAVWAGQDSHDTGEVRSPDFELTPGQTVRVGLGDKGTVGEVSVADVGAWHQGWLVFERTPLPEVVERWNDYLVRPLELTDDAALRELRLTGSFPLRDPGAFLASLPSVLPVQVERTPQGVQTIRLRR